MLKKKFYAAKGRKATKKSGQNLLCKLAYSVIK
jgi:hypothetical protein